jgi:hypothetical protein
MFYIEYSWLEITTAPGECAGLALVLDGLGVDSGVLWELGSFAGVWRCSSRIVVGYEQAVA